MHLNSVTLYPEKYPTREQHPFDLPIFQQAGRIEFPTPVTMFVGENGTGKSTLMEALCRKCGIHIWQDPDRLRFVRNPYEEMLHQYISLEWANGRVPGSFFGADNFKYFTQAVDEWAVSDPGQLEHFGGRSLVTQSHGQSLMSYFTSRYQIPGLYLLDEPETALSPKTQLLLLGLLERMACAGHAQFIVATHSPILLSCPGATIYSFDRVPLRPVSYVETEHFQVYRKFMEGLKL
jgi:predicted ATPase